MSACIVRDHRMGNSMLQKFPCGQACALISRPRFIYPHMNLNSFIEGFIYRSCGGAPINAGEPAGIAVRKNIDGLIFLLARDSFDQCEAVFTYFLASFYILIRKPSGGFKSNFNFLLD